MGADDRAETGGELQPDRYYLLGDAGSFFFEPAGGGEDMAPLFGFLANAGTVVLLLLGAIVLFAAMSGNTQS